MEEGEKNIKAEKKEKKAERSRRGRVRNVGKHEREESSVDYLPLLSTKLGSPSALALGLNEGLSVKGCK